LSRLGLQDYLCGQIEQVTLKVMLTLCNHNEYLFCYTAESAKSQFSQKKKEKIKITAVYSERD